MVPGALHHCDRGLPQPDVLEVHGKGAEGEEADEGRCHAHKAAHVPRPHAPRELPEPGHRDEQAPHGHERRGPCRRDLRPLHVSQKVAEAEGRGLLPPARRRGGGRSRPLSCCRRWGGAQAPAPPGPKTGGEEEAPRGERGEGREAWPPPWPPCPRCCCRRGAEEQELLPRAHRGGQEGGGEHPGHRRLCKERGHQALPCGSTLLCLPSPHYA
mmetsp:Transcript_13033/g.41188  ORF Transcript_13033/g.41188 Transcript_13033/m.41188 type:complete len:213 (+) Transcript_13033:694-1332(+)